MEDETHGVRHKDFLPSLSCESAKANGVRQTPHLAPLSAKGGLRLAPRGLQTAGSVAQDICRLLRKFGKTATGFRVFGFEIWVFGTGS